MQSRYRSFPLSLLALGLLVACATLPPEAPIPDLQSIEGRWKGLGETEQHGEGMFELTIRRDGSLEMFLPGPRIRAKGQARVVGGRVLFETPDSTGTLLLREGEGRRVLLGTTKGKNFADDGSFEVTPVGPDPETSSHSG